MLSKFYKNQDTLRKLHAAGCNNVRVLCSNHHPMKKLSWNKLQCGNFCRFEIKCNLCNHWIPKKEYPPYSCHLCNYHLCTYCHDKELIDAVNLHLHTGVERHDSDQRILKYNYEKSKYYSRLARCSLPYRRMQESTIRYPHFWENPYTELSAYNDNTLDYMKQHIDRKCWYKSLTLLIKIIEKAWRPWDDNKFKPKYHRINYDRLKAKLFKYSQGHDCYHYILNLIHFYGFVYKPRKGYGLWDHPRLVMDAELHLDIQYLNIWKFYCEIKSMIEHNYKWSIHDRNEFVDNLLIAPISIITYGYCFGDHTYEMYPEIYKIVYSYITQKEDVLILQEDCNQLWSFCDKIRYIQGLNCCHVCIFKVYEFYYLFMKLQ